MNTTLAQTRETRLAALLADFPRPFGVWQAERERLEAADTIAQAELDRADLTHITPRGFQLAEPLCPEAALIAKLHDVTHARHYLGVMAQTATRMLEHEGTWMEREWHCFSSVSGRQFYVHFDGGVYEEISTRDLPAEA